ncbi:hypothetical protein QJQ45_029649 [Haematococcus lacustris]|nr:hypothetical protein QJQ45_029649 [Haematococcus lacustris]
MDAIEVNNARDMRRRTARRRWKQIILQVLLSVVQWVVEEGLVVKRQAIHVAHWCHPRIFDVVVLLGRRRYNRVSEYWKEPRNYKTLYPNVIEVMGPVAREKAFLSRFHMSSELFKKVYTAILGHPLLERNCKRKDFLTIAEQLGVFCTFAAQGGSYTQVALAMGCSTTSVSRCVNSVSTAIWDRLSMKIAWPRTEEELRTNVLGFEELSGLVQVVGAIDGTHVRLASVPANGGHDYYCHKGFHSIVAQAVVNHQGKAMDVHVGHAGRAHDANVFSDSPVGRQLLDRGSEIAQALSRSMQSVGGVNVG